MTTRHTLFSAFAVLVLALAAQAQVELVRSVFSASGFTGNSGSFELSSTLGQAVAGRAPAPGGDLTLDAGFWAPDGPAAPACPADFNSDGSLDPDDLGDYINCYFSQPPCPQADFNGDGSTDPDDLGDFINAYFGGC
ncbi:MAG: GC-type dockerin domain-anchored protein [Phycisphaerales bacterium]